MNPEEKVLLERTLKLSEENNLILRRMQRSAKWALYWGFLKVAFIVVPLVVGYLFLQPFIEQAAANYGGVREFLNF